MRKWVRSCAVFMLGWFAGCTFVMLLVMDHGPPSLHGAHEASLYPTERQAAVEHLKGLAARSRAFTAAAPSSVHPKPGTLPHWAEMPVNYSVSFPLYFSWGHDARQFSIYNYKVLESMLMHYPTAKVLLHSSPVVAECDVPLSANHFVKYSKMGFDIEHLPHDQPYRLRSEYGGEFWDRWTLDGCLTANCTQPLPRALLQQLREGKLRQPYFAEIYQHIAHLWKTGGIYNDFSYFFLGHIEGSHGANQEGCRIHTVCGHHRLAPALPPACTAAATKVHAPDTPTHHRTSGSGLKSWAYARWDASGGHTTRAARGGQCFVSTTMIFKQPYSNTLDCVLRHYAQPSFRQCLASDLWVLQTGQVNLTSDGAYHRGGGGQNSSGSGTQRYSWGAGQGADCVRQAFRDCFAELRTENILEQTGASGILEDFSDNRRSAALLVKNATRHPADDGWSLLPSSRVLWLGADPVVAFGTSYPGHAPAADPAPLTQLRGRGTEKTQRAPGRDDNSLISDVAVEDTAFALPGSILFEATRSLTLRDTRARRPAGSMNEACHTFASNPDISREITDRTLARSFCAPVVLIPGFARSAGAFITSALVSHPNLLPQLYHSGVHDVADIAATRISTGHRGERAAGHTGAHCYPTEAVSISTVLSSDWMRKHVYANAFRLDPSSSTEADSSQAEHHPNTLRRSADNTRESRKYCFPLIEKSEQFLSVHTDSSYVLGYDLPFEFRKDSPTVKTLFVIRDPVARMYSHYKHLYGAASVLVSLQHPTRSPEEVDAWVQGWLPRFDVLVEMTTSREGPLGRLREHFTAEGGANGESALRNMIREYYDIVDRGRTLYAMSPAAACSLLRRTKAYWASHSNHTDFVDYVTDMHTGVIDSHTFEWLLAAIPREQQALLEESDKASPMCLVFTHFIAMGYELQTQSIYLPPILHFGNSMGMGNILVINSDDLDPGNERRFRRIMSAIFLFLGVSRFDVTGSVLDSIEPSTTVVPLSHQISKQGHARLQSFFSVFNDHLELAAGLNLTSWMHAPPPHQAPQQNAFVRTNDVILSDRSRNSHSNSSSGFPLLPRAWYDKLTPDPDLEEVRPSGFKLLWWLADMGSAGGPPGPRGTSPEGGDEVPGSVVGYLDQGSGWKEHMGHVIEAFLPKGKLSESDVGFNTTIGMLSSF